MKKLLLTAALAALLAACGEAQAPDIGRREQAAQVNTQERLVQATPIPALQYSAERVNLVKRAERLNTENLNGCVTLISYGRVIAQYNVDGKVSSLNSYLTGSERPIDDPHGSYDSGSVMMESPDVDGTYGENIQGVFFFEANTNAYVEWHGDFLYSDQCLTPNERPAMTRVVP